MTGYERFMTALRREQPDRVPLWELIVNGPVIEKLYGPGVSYLDFAEREDLDGVCVGENYHSTPLDDTHWLDEWGITWGQGKADAPYPADHPIRSAADVDSFTVPDPDADHRLTTLADAVRRFKGDRAIVFLGHDAFEFSAMLRGMDNLLMDYALDPELVHRVARLVIDYKKRVMARALEMGADVALSGDDYAYRHGPMMSPTHFREFVLPYLQEIVDVAHARGVPYIKHCDGNIWSLLDMLVDEAGIDALDPMEPLAGMDIGKVKEKYGDRIALCGNIDCSVLLTRGTPEMVVEAVKETIAKASVGGGHIMASSNSIHPAVNPDLYVAMVRATREFGVYPLDEQMIAEYRRKNYIEAILGQAG
ncbi:MAG TPA: uroporphyrinogen decarboxylase family protein [Armatimonadota bacterium]|jgi:uroporphyrinogen decarboxylase